MNAITFARVAATIGFEDGTTHSLNTSSEPEHPERALLDMLRACAALLVQQGYAEEVAWNAVHVGVAMGLNRRRTEGIQHA